MSVLRCEAEGGGELVVELVNVLVEETVVEQSVSAVVPCVFQDEEECDLGLGVRGIPLGREGRDEPGEPWR